MSTTTLTPRTIDFDRFQQNLMRLRGDPSVPPDVSIIIPVNAQGDLTTVLTPLSDIIQYDGKHTLEVILVINNYPPDNPPSAIEEYQRLGIHVVAEPSARRPGEVVIISARALGVRSALADINIHFDADCRIANINALIDWYVRAFHSGAKVAYSHVGYYDLRNRLSVRARIAIHHAVRWMKRAILHIPTTRGSNYAVDRLLFLQLYDTGRLSVDLQVGPAAKLTGARIDYSGHPDLSVSTSGRRFQGGWKKLYRYLLYRLRYNVKATSTRHREVTRLSWEGFDRESENRAASSLPPSNPEVQK